VRGDRRAEPHDDVMLEDGSPDRGRPAGPCALPVTHASYRKYTWTLVPAMAIYIFIYTHIYRTHIYIYIHINTYTHIYIYSHIYI